MRLINCKSGMAGSSLMQCDASTKNKFAWGFCASGCLGIAICAEVNKFVVERLVGVAIVTKARCCCACWLG